MKRTHRRRSARALGKAPPLLCLWTAWSALAAVPSPVVGDTLSLDAIGFRAATSTTDSKDLDQAMAFASWNLPWHWTWGSWAVRPRLDAAAGVLSGKGGNGFSGSVGPALRLQLRAKPAVLFDLGVSPTYLGKHEFEDVNLGGSLQFTSHVGIGVEVGDNPRLGIAYRFQHISNASIYSQNPGVEMHVLEVGLRF